jgi:hypothetical protein
VLVIEAACLVRLPAGTFASVQRCCGFGASEDGEGVRLRAELGRLLASWFGGLSLLAVLTVLFLISYLIPEFAFELKAMITSSSESDIVTAASSTTATESDCPSNPTATFLMRRVALTAIEKSLPSPLYGSRVLIASCKCLHVLVGVHRGCWDAAICL